MGIPFLYPWFTANFGHNIKEVYDDIDMIDNLMLDFNAMIHPVVKTILDSNKRRLLRKSTINETEMFNKII